MGSLWACVAMVQENMKEATGSRVHGGTQQKMQGLCHTLKLSAFFILPSLVTPSTNITVSCTLQGKRDT